MSNLPDYTALWREDASQDELVATYQTLIDNGQAWRLEGSVGRMAMDLINDGLCVLGEIGYCDYWGNYVPARDEVEAGTPGSVEYCSARQSGQR